MIKTTLMIITGWSLHIILAIMIFNLVELGFRIGQPWPPIGLILICFVISVGLATEGR